VQQRLVALALEASLLARREQASGPQPLSRQELLDSIDATIALTSDVMRDGTPAVLDAGLAAGLAALEATVPILSTLDIDGDLPADHPATAVLWFVACEAVANTLKHANATQIGLRLHVGDAVAELTVVDNGVGGAPGSPLAIIRRLAAVPSTATVDSPPGRGTALEVHVDLVGARVPA
jgi:signal transduction histidine kinase